MEDRIKKVLENLFYKIIDVNSNLPKWVKNTTKYGDNFIFISSGKASIKNPEEFLKENPDFVPRFDSYDMWRIWEEYLHPETFKDED